MKFGTAGGKNEKRRTSSDPWIVVTWKDPKFIERQAREFHQFQKEEALKLARDMDEMGYETDCYSATLLVHYARTNPVF